MNRTKFQIKLDSTSRLSIVLQIYANVCEVSAAYALEPFLHFVRQICVRYV